MRTLVFSVALNGYQWRYRSLIASHQAYADKYGYDYVCVTKPSFSTLGLEVAWLKIRLIVDAIDAGFDQIMFLDADTRVQAICPSIESATNTEDEIYAAKGFSGRINSGVLIVKSSPRTRAFFKKLLLLATRPIPAVDSVGWGENGHIIHFARQFEGFGILDRKWNNNTDPGMDDYIRHYSRGPLYSLFTPSKEDALKAKTMHYLLAIIKRLSISKKNNSYPVHFFMHLDRLAQQAKRHYRLLAC